MKVVNSWNEWDPLEEVIVGSARGAADIGYEPALAPYFRRDDSARAFRGAAVSQTIIDEAERQLDDFAEVLNRLGIIVRRPDPIDHWRPVKTPDWEISGGARECLSPGFAANNWRRDHRSAHGPAGALL